jgi:hypothetical protein
LVIFGHGRRVRRGGGKRNDREGEPVGPTAPSPTPSPVRGGVRLERNESELGFRGRRRAFSFVRPFSMLVRLIASDGQDQRTRFRAEYGPSGALICWARPRLRPGRQREQTMRPGRRTRLGLADTAALWAGVLAGRFGHWAADKESACALGRSEESSSAGPPSGRMHRNGFTFFF